MAWSCPGFLRVVEGRQAPAPFHPLPLPTHGLSSLPLVFCLLGGDGFLMLRCDRVCVPRVVAGLAGLMENAGGGGGTSG